MQKPTTTSETHWILFLASVVVIVAALYFAKSLLITFSLAVLVSFLLAPVCDWVERRRVGRVPAVLGTALLGFAMVGLAAWAATLQMSQMGPKIPEYTRNFEMRIANLNVTATSVLSRLTRSAQEAGDDRTRPESEPQDDEKAAEKEPDSVEVISALGGSLQSFGGMFGTLLEIIGTVGIIIVLVVFFLIRRDDLRDRFIHLMGEGNVTLTTRMLEDANTRVRSYLSMLFLINGSFGVCVAIGLYLIGVPGWILWGIGAASLRFIPYIGEWIAAAMPIMLSFAISTGWWIPLMTIGLFLGLELFSSNVLEPLLYGRNTGVSAVAVFVAAIFWMWLWGPVGLILATPLTVCVFVLGKHIPHLGFLETMLGKDSVFEPKTRIYQRLLAGDQDEAMELVDDFIQGKSLVEVYDEVLLPAVVLNEKHWQLEELYEEKYRFNMRSLREMIQIYGDRPPTPPVLDDELESGAVDGIAKHVTEDLAPPLDILCLPARTESDELTALMLVEVLKIPEACVRAVSIRSLDCEMANWAAADHPDVIFVCATPPASVMHARNVCKLIREELPHVKLIVGLWGTADAMDATTERFGHDAIVVVTMADAQQQIRELIASSGETADRSAATDRDRITLLPVAIQPKPAVGT
ncbi:MAG: AI-2E family transporter [Planctomycetaceae bacterium]|nr:MAG: AI-2E family transporter [Planctomycetaceae bacterium]